MKVHVQILDNSNPLPSYAKLSDAGMDVYSSKDVIIDPGETEVVPVGLAVAIPEGYEIQIRPRSGISCRTKLRISNSPGTIDAGYRNEIGVIIDNISNIRSKIIMENNNIPPHTIDVMTAPHGIYQIKKGDRIAQIVLKKVETIEWDVVDDVKIIGTDRCGGFGSTGVK